jgi:NAD(P)-dependent dehydrogenase (short-subunit alcohol dehydrogenase family)
MKNIDHIPKEFTAESNSLKDKVILVTGAGDGIGRIAALTFARHGATVLLLGKTESKLNAVYDEIEAEHLSQPALLPFDLNSTDPEHYKTIAKVIDENFGRLDGLLHNAGILGDRSSIASYKAQRWMETIQVNVTSVFMLTQVLLPLLVKSKNASIVFTSSGVGRKGRAYWGAYGVSKFAIEGLMETLADELVNTSQIRVNCINPGATRTRMRALAYPAENPEILKTPDDIMPIYLYLMGDQSRAITGRSFDAQSM